MGPAAFPRPGLVPAVPFPDFHDVGVVPVQLVEPSPIVQFKPCGVLAQEGGHQMRRSQYICFYQYLFIHLNKGSLVLPCAHMAGPHCPPIITLFTQSHRVSSLVLDRRSSFRITVPCSGYSFLSPVIILDLSHNQEPLSV